MLIRKNLIKLGKIKWRPKLKIRSVWNCLRRNMLKLSIGCMKKEIKNIRRPFLTSYSKELADLLRRLIVAMHTLSHNLISRLNLEEEYIIPSHLHSR